MKRFFSLIRASMFEGMNLFKINTKKKSKASKILLPIFLTFALMGAMFSYSEILLQELVKVNMEYVVLPVFVLLISFMTIIEGIYKSGNLLFNCKDDNLILSLPLNKGTVLFIRVFKFYIFELLYNSLFIIPTMVAYAIEVNPGKTFYIISAISLFIFPIIPILISCVVGSIITYLSSKFSKKNHIATILTFLLLLGVFYFSYNMQGLVSKIAENANSVNDLITKIYYPAGAYVDLVLNYTCISLIRFLLINIALFVLSIVIMGKLYFKINSSTKSIKIKKSTKEYKIKSSKPMNALIKKELSRFINSTVFITNAGFGILLFIIGCIYLVIKYNGVIEAIPELETALSSESLKNFVPLVLYGFVCLSCFLTSITSSMISLEGKTFTVLKSLPVKPYTIIQSKILTAILVMIPFLILGDLIVFIRFSFDIISIIIILIASIIFPLISETIGILVNLKYPKMDAQNDTEVVKQSMSSTLSVFIGMGLIGLTGYLIYKAIGLGISFINIMLIITCFYTLTYAVLLIYLKRTCEKSFNNIDV